MSVCHTECMRVGSSGSWSRSTYIRVFILSEVISLILSLTPTPSLLRFSDLLGAAQLSLT